MILNILKEGNDILYIKSVDITDNYKNLNILIDNMFETLELHQGLGLAAPQIGLNINLFVIKYIGKNYVFINPKVKNKSQETTLEFESCLSIPKETFLIKRYKDIELQYLDKNFNEINQTFTGFFARIIQHELDHLDGILISSY